ncbi:MAG TPA: hypothetical protein VIL74_11810 [Pyrinomonadaceae bacterium]
MAKDAILYRAALASGKGRAVVVKQSGGKLTIALEGFGKLIEFAANGGGTSTCRTVLEHNSSEATVLVSLAVPDPRAACRMLPSYISVESRAHNISLDDESLRKTAGNNASLRKAVEQILGKIESEGGE